MTTVANVLSLQLHTLYPPVPTRWPFLGDHYSALEAKWDELALEPRFKDDIRLNKASLPLEVYRRQRLHPLPPPPSNTDRTAAFAACGLRRNVEGHHPGEPRRGT